MKHTLSHNGNLRRIQSGASRPVLAGLLAAGLITGCASSGTAEPETAGVTADNATPATVALEPEEQASDIDHSPSASARADGHSEPQPDTDVAATPEENDMTVLVLDNPELMARAAQVQAASKQVSPMQDSPRKPHQMKFYFGFDKHRLSDADQAVLREHAEYLKAHPEVTLRINGHTDSHGPDEYNAFLSRLRATSAAKILKQAGIDGNRIEIVGWGSHKPLTNPEDSAANRRLELEYHSEQMARVQ
ncbi:MULTISPECIES: OmpA family protein [Marinobacter]|uniref:OmpA family protein n=1 Tax=Marinobacter TaxID=2742 RepID=UPI001D17ADD9|nr:MULTISPECIES: OmpA family protein [Marinobacter]